MSSREIVEKTLEYDYPERVARSFADSDFVFCRYIHSARATDFFEVKDGRWERIDKWRNLVFLIIQSPRSRFASIGMTKQCKLFYDPSSKNIESC